MSSISIINQYIKDLSIELPHSPQIFLKQYAKPNIDISIDIDAKKLINDENKEEDKKIFEVILKISAEATIASESKDNSKKEEKLFILEISYAGLFQINEENSEIIELEEELEIISEMNKNNQLKIEEMFESFKKEAEEKILCQKNLTFNFLMNF